MARLLDGDLCLEIKYLTFEYGWITYDIFWLWRDEPVINDAVFKRHNEHWGRRSPGAWNANECFGETIVPFIERVLETNTADSIATTDPDLTLAIYPEGMEFPFIPSRDKVVYEAEHVKNARAERDALKAELGKLPDDPFEILMFFDVYNFKEAWAYSGSGLCLRMQTTRLLLETFATELFAEYVEFDKRFGIEEWHEERDRDDSDTNKS